jgi:tRNA 2-thiocytidine biosynthesis protein TtcA
MNLQLPLALPPWTGLGKKLESMCRKAIFEFSLLENVDKVAIALSGGKDSLTLLFLLNSIRGKGMPFFDLQAIHVGGEYSCGAGIGENYLQRICDALEIPLTICRATKQPERCYSCSRERRKLIFDAAKLRGITTVAFGHHRDDSIQTLMMNLLHKGEFSANLPKVGMHDFGVTIIRPLLYIAEEEIVEFAKKYGFARITCQCPIGQDSMRKKVKVLIEEIEELFPNTKQNLFLAGMEYGSDKALRKIGCIPLKSGVLNRTSPSINLE